MNRHELFSLVRFPFLLLCVLLTISCRNTADDRRMAQIINEADSLNRNDIAMSNDSLLLMACSYYDRYGTPNEQMRAHYLLGCVYRDRGEAPRAIDSYKDAIAKADTTASDCDYHVLGCVYSQMADVYYQQLLLSNELDSRKQAIQYAERASDTLGLACDLKSIGATYILLHQLDSAENSIKKSLSLYRQLGMTEDEVQSSTVLMSLYVEKDCLENLKQLIDRFESESELFKDNIDLPPIKRQYYYYKGKYYEGVQHLDSAEYYYRKIYYSGMSFVAMDPMYRGLLSVFEKRHEADSIAKYARLFCMVNDSSIAINDQEMTARMAASYQYNSFQRQAHEKEIEADRAQMILVILCVTIALVGVILLTSWNQYKRKQQFKLNLLKTDYADATEKYSRNLHTLQLLEESHKAVIQEIQTELDNAKQENSSFRKQNSEVKHQFIEQNAKFELEKAELQEENTLLRQRIEDFQLHGDIARTVNVAHDYFEEGIMRRVFSLLKTPQISLSENEKKQLLMVTTQYYPALIHDLKVKGHLPPLAIFVCILTAANLRSSDIANLLSVSFQQVSNLKQQINVVLFNNSTARSLYSNIVRHYEIYLG